MNEDLFVLAAGKGFDLDLPRRGFHAISVDIDHPPRHLLHPSHAGFYSLDGTRPVAHLLHPGGVFAPWSNDPPDDDYRRVLARSFETVHVEVVTIHNPLQGCDSKNTVYVGAHRASKPAAA